MAEALLTFSARELLKKVAVLAGEEFSIVWGFKKEIARMRITSVNLQVMLQAAENLTGNLDAGVKVWVKKIEDIAGHADDLLDDFGYEVIRRKVEKKKVSSLFDPLVFRHKMGRRIKKINESLEKLEKQAASFHLVIAGQERSDDSGVLDRQTVPCFKSGEKNMIGRGEVVSDIVTTLIRANNVKDLSVLAIVGMAGLGKTTVAKAIYNDREIGRHFQRKIWVCVPTPFDVEMVLCRILGYLNAEMAAVRGKATILKYLQDQLEGKKYLLVLDDVWNAKADEWNDLRQVRDCLLSIDGTKGSSIIVTTRIGKVAEVMETVPRIDMGKLSHDECWLILKNNADLIQNTLPEDQERTGREIAKKCGGVPLVAEVLGSLMRFKNNHEWLEIEKSTIWDLEERLQIFEVLKLSFSGLQSPSLKNCFACCSIFKKDVEMEKDDLIELWMAMGLLEPFSVEESEEEMKNKGTKYFNILLGSSLFQHVSKAEDGTITHCKMHDLVHDLAEQVSESMFLRPDSNNIRTLEHTHHQMSILEGSVRKLLSNDESIGRMLPGFKTLRALKLYKKDIVELPNSIGKLKHLRYLDISRTYIEALPKSFGKLYNLQTLRMSHDLCLERLPKEMENLINLRHLYFDGRLQFPVGIGKLTNLRSFTNYRKGEGCGIDELSGLNYLNGELCIYKLERVRDGQAAKKANLVGKTTLRKLSFEWSHFYNVQGSNEACFPLQRLKSLSEVYRFSGESLENQWLNDDDVLEGLRPPSNLESMEIHRFNGDRFPLWTMSNLKEIELVDCSKSEGLPILGHLPNLNHIRIREMHNLKCVRSEFYGYDHVDIRSEESRSLFPKLKTFNIEQADNLTAVLPTERKGVFPCLEELIVKFCKQLISAPTHFPSLQRLEMQALDNAAMPIKSILNRNLTSLTSLKIISVGGFTCLPVEGLFENNNNLAHLDLSGCYDLTHIGPPGVGLCSSLKSLCIDGCRYLAYIPHGLLTPSLQKLELSFCKRLKYFPDITHGYFTSLQTLSISYCDKLVNLPNGLQYCPSLETLEIRNCFKLRYIHTVPHGLPSLRKFKIRECGLLSGLLIGVETCTSILSFAVSACPVVRAFPINTTSLQKLTLSKLEFLPTVPGGLTSLRKLTIQSCQSPQIRVDFCASVQVLTIHDCSELETAPDLDNLTSLRKLCISVCPRLTTLPRLVSHPCLTHLAIGPLCEELDSIPFSQDVISVISPHLDTLKLCGWPKLKSLPDEIQQFTSLTNLDIMMFDELEAIPEWLGNLASLQELIISDCKNLKCVPEALQRRDSSGEIFMALFDCPLVKEGCSEDQNSDESECEENNPGGSEGDSRQSITNQPGGGLPAASHER